MYTRWTILFAATLLAAPGFAQEDELFDETLPPPGFSSSQPDFLDLPMDDLDLDLDEPEPEPVENSAPAEPAATGDPSEMKALEIELPDPYFGGTPLDYSSPILEKPDYKPRPDFMVPGDVTNIALGKPVMTSESPKAGLAGMLVDGDTHYGEDSVLMLPAGHQYVQIDFEGLHELYGLLLWHFHEGERVYFDVVIQIADDDVFTENVRTLFNNDQDNTLGLGAGEDLEYVEDYRGKFIKLDKPTAAAIRFHSNGNTTDDFNHYVEAQVFGRPVQ